MVFISEFPNSVIENIGYYVYILKDPINGEVFYIGKGVGNRVFCHVNDSLDQELLGDRLERIRNINAQGLDVDCIIHRHGLTEKEAFEVESALIDYVGLVRLTNSVQGLHADDRGRMKVSEVIAKYEAPDATITEPVILIRINKYYRRGISHQELYDITRGSWKVGTRRNKVKYAFSVYRGIVREVYEIDRWAPIYGDSPGRRDYILRISGDCWDAQSLRYEFEGRVSNDLQHYVGCSVSKYLKPGAQGSFQYVNC